MCISTSDLLSTCFNCLNNIKFINSFKLIYFKCNVMQPIYNVLQPICNVLQTICNVVQPICNAVKPICNAVQPLPEFFSPYHIFFSQYHMFFSPIKWCAYAICNQLPCWVWVWVTIVFLSISNTLKYYSPNYDQLHSGINAILFLHSLRFINYGTKQQTIWLTSE